MKNNYYREFLNEQKENLPFKRECHYECARYYDTIDKTLGLISIILAVTILGFAFAFLGGNLAYYWQVTLAILTIVQGITLVTQLYYRADKISNHHYNIGARLGSLTRQLRFLSCLIESNLDKDYTEEIKLFIMEHDSISKEASYIPKKIIKKTKKNFNDVPEHRIVKPH